MKRDYVKGNNIGDQIKSINRLFQYVFPRLGKKMTCIIPPIPIFAECNKVDEKGFMFRKILPIDGIITEVFMHIDWNGKNEGSFAIVISDSNGSNTFKFTTKKSDHVEVVNYAITKGSLLTMYTDTPDAFSNVYLSALITTNIRNVSKEEILLEERNAEEIAQEVGKPSE
jgi:hypothetical protein